MSYVCGEQRGNDARIRSLRKHFLAEMAASAALDAVQVVVDPVRG